MKATFKVATDDRRFMPVDYGQFIKLRRKQLGLTLPKLAELAGISKGGPSRIERGADFQISTLNKLCIPLRLYPTLAADKIP